MIGELFRALLEGALAQHVLGGWPRFLSSDHRIERIYQGRNGAIYLEWSTT